ncbi:hypothetical protein Bpfe_025183, partial [Biomphalaria pfeifferi]
MAFVLGVLQVKFEDWWQCSPSLRRPSAQLLYRQKNHLLYRLVTFTLPLISMAPHSLPKPFFSKRLVTTGAWLANGFNGGATLALMTSFL